MATRGRNICNTLKAIRKQIADANEIDYSPEECHFKGECKGTCPKCEQDVKDLEYELRLRQMAGKTIKVAGVALGITALAASATSCSTQKGYNSFTLTSSTAATSTSSTSSTPEKNIPIRFREYTADDSTLLQEKEALNKKGVLFVQGHVIDDEDEEPIVGAYIIAKLSGKKTISNRKGNFTLEVSPNDTISVEYVGMQYRAIKLTEMSQEKLNIITLAEDERYLGEMVAGIVPVEVAYPIIKKDKSSKKSRQEKKSKLGKTAIIQPAVNSDSTESSKLFGEAIEEMASFPGGSVALMQYIKDNVRYPEECQEGAATGRVIVGFTVNEDGSLSDIKVMRSITPKLDKEAIRVVKSMPKWNPAKQNGKAVKTKYTVPVTFRLE